MAGVYAQLASIVQAQGTLLTAVDRTAAVSAQLATTAAERDKGAQRPEPRACQPLGSKPSQSRSRTPRLARWFARGTSALSSPFRVLAAGLMRCFYLSNAFVYLAVTRRGERLAIGLVERFGREGVQVEAEVGAAGAGHNNGGLPTPSARRRQAISCLTV